MEGKERAVNAYGKNWSLIDFIKKCFVKNDKLKLLGKYNLNVKAATEPDLIQWMNLGVSDNVRLFLAFLNLLLTISIFVSVTGFILWLKNLQDKVSKEIPNFNTEKILTLEDAE